MNFPNPGSDIRLRMQETDVHRKYRKTVASLVVMKLFLDFLGASRTCVIIVFSMSVFWNFTQQVCQNKQLNNSL